VISQRKQDIQDERKPGMEQGAGDEIEKKDGDGSSAEKEGAQGKDSEQDQEEEQEEEGKDCVSDNDDKGTFKDEGDHAAPVPKLSKKTLEQAAAKLREEKVEDPRTILEAQKKTRAALRKAGKEDAADDESQPRTPESLPEKAREGAGAEAAK